ncbi:MAG: hypothetical protein RL033_5086 [Pseudomonadota bacterium]|jgi:hypothetical protein
MSKTPIFLSTARAAFLLTLSSACTLDVGQNFQVAEVVYDDSFFYCQVEPMLFQQGCGSGDSSRGESAQGCHFNRQRLRLTDYSPLAADQCVDGELGELGAPQAAQQNYQSAQLQMEVDPDRSPLLNRPTSEVAHPRVVFELTSEQAEVIRTWGSRYSSR